jgi:hypothetical protein
VEVTTTTGGSEMDADGYTVTVDGGTAQAIAAAGSMRSNELTPGAHVVHLGGVALNCTVAGDNPRTVEVQAGATATVAFAIDCSATTGGLQVTSSTTGASADPDGYVVTVDGTDQGALAASGSLNLAGITPGSHLVGLSGVAANCQVDGGNPRAVSVTAGAAADVAFAVICSAPPQSAGTLRIITVTSGPDLDARDMGLGRVELPTSHLSGGPRRKRIPDAIPVTH